MITEAQRKEAIAHAAYWPEKMRSDIISLATYVTDVEFQEHWNEQLEQYKKYDMDPPIYSTSYFYEFIENRCNLDGRLLKELTELPEMGERRAIAIMPLFQALLEAWPVQCRKIMDKPEYFLSIPSSEASKRVLRDIFAGKIYPPEKVDPFRPVFNRKSLQALRCYILTFWPED